MVCAKLTSVFLSTVLLTNCSVLDQFYAASAEYRTADTYAIYNQLLAINGRASEPAFLSLRDTTIAAVGPEDPCKVKHATTTLERARTSHMNPHNAGEPPDDHKESAAYAEMLTDFDAHCHEQARLDQSRLRQTIPIHLLDEMQQAFYRERRNEHAPADAQKYQNSSSLLAFSRVYFNSDNSRAIVYMTSWCGGLCGKGLDRIWKAGRAVAATALEDYLLGFLRK